MSLFAAWGSSHYSKGYPTQDPGKWNTKIRSWQSRWPAAHYESHFQLSSMDALSLLFTFCHWQMEQWHASKVKPALPLALVAILDSSRLSKTSTASYCLPRCCQRRMGYHVYMHQPWPPGNVIQGAGDNDQYPNTCPPHLAKLTWRWMFVHREMKLTHAREKLKSCDVWKCNWISSADELMGLLISAQIFKH